MLSSPNLQQNPIKIVVIRNLSNCFLITQKKELNQGNDYWNQSLIERLIEAMNKMFKNVSRFREYSKTLIMFPQRWHLHCVNIQIIYFDLFYIKGCLYFLKKGKSHSKQGGLVFINSIQQFWSIYCPWEDALIIPRPYFTEYLFY